MLSARGRTHRKYFALELEAEAHDTDRERGAGDGAVGQDQHAADEILANVLCARPFPQAQNTSESEIRIVLVWRVGAGTRSWNDGVRAWARTVREVKAQHRGEGERDQKGDLRPDLAIGTRVSRGSTIDISASRYGTIMGLKHVGGSSCRSRGDLEQVGGAVEVGLVPRGRKRETQAAQQCHLWRCRAASTGQRLSVSRCTAFAVHVGGGRCLIALVAYNNLQETARADEDDEAADESLAEHFALPGAETAKKDG